MRKLLNAFTLLLPLVSIGQTPAFIQDSLDAYVARGMAKWEIPGMALVVIKDGKTIVSKGYGVKEVGKPDRVDAETQFMIASNSKLFTGTALAHADYYKRLRLDDKVSQYLPGFRVYDSLVSPLITVRDMLTHRIGTKTFQGDFTFLNSNLSRADIANRISRLKPSGVFRQDYGYCNSCFLTAGQVFQAATKMSWEQFVTDSLLKPLGMNHTTALGNDMELRPNVARPYTNIYTGKIERLPYDQWDNLAPAASIVSCVSDLGKWLRFQLDSGKVNGKRLMPWPILQKTRDVNIITGSRKSPLFPVHFRGYGLGLFSSDYKGRQIFWHTGGADGMLSGVCFVPEERLGIAILTNQDNQSFFEALRYQILDAYTSSAYTDRSAQMWKFFDAPNKATNDSVKAWQKHIGRANPDLPLKSFGGKYTHPVYGLIEVTANKKDLHVTFSHHPSLNATLAYIGQNEWLLTYNHKGYGIHKTNFDITKDGVVSDLTIKVNDFLEIDPYVFKKMN